MARVLKHVYGIEKSTYKDAMTSYIYIVIV